MFMKSCVHAFLGNAAFHGFILSQQVHGDLSDRVEVLGRVTGAGSTGIFLVGDIEAPVQLVLDAPMGPNRIANLPGIGRQRTDVKRR
jgi:hypothetical protein